MFENELTILNGQRLTEEKLLKIEQKCHICTILVLFDKFLNSIIHNIRDWLSCFASHEREVAVPSKVGCTCGDQPGLPSCLLRNPGHLHHR